MTYSILITFLWLFLSLAEMQPWLSKLFVPGCSFVCLLFLYRQATFTYLLFFLALMICFKSYVYQSSFLVLCEMLSFVILRLLEKPPQIPSSSDLTLSFPSVLKTSFQSLILYGVSRFLFLLLSPLHTVQAPPHFTSVFMLLFFNYLLLAVFIRFPLYRLDQRLFYWLQPSGFQLQLFEARKLKNNKRRRFGLKSDW